MSRLLLDMGYNAAPRVLDQALDAMDPDATGEVTKVRGSTAIWNFEKPNSPAHCALPPAGIPRVV